MAAPADPCRREFATVSSSTHAPEYQPEPILKIDAADMTQRSISLDPTLLDLRPVGLPLLRYRNRVRACRRAIYLFGAPPPSCPWCDPQSSCARIRRKKEGC